MKYCRYCVSCISGDYYYCTSHEKVLSDNQIKHSTSCQDFVLSEMGDVDTGEQYKPRIRHNKIIQQEKSLFELKEG